MVLVFKMNKKGTQPEYRTLVQLILFAAVTLAIAIPMYTKYYETRLATPKTGTTKAMDAIRIEINNIYSDRDLPIYVDENHIIKIFPANSAGRPDAKGCKEEKDKSCICVCTAETCEGNEVNACRTFDADFFKQEYVIYPKIVDDTAVTHNCLFVVGSDRKVAMEKCT